MAVKKATPKTSTAKTERGRRWEKFSAVVLDYIEEGGLLPVGASHPEIQRQGHAINMLPTIAAAIFEVWEKFSFISQDDERR